MREYRLLLRYPPQYRRTHGAGGSQHFNRLIRVKLQISHILGDGSNGICKSGAMRIDQLKLKRHQCRGDFLSPAASIFSSESDFSGVINDDAVMAARVFARVCTTNSSSTRK